MKTFFKYLALLILVATIASGCSQKQGYTIDGTIDANEGTIYLQSFRNKMFFIIDSAEIENGKFQFTGRVDREDLFGLTTDKDEAFYSYFIFIENTDIQIDITSSERRNATISGSYTHDLYESYLANRRDFNIDSFIVAHPTSVVPAYVLYRDFSTRLSVEELESSVNKIDPSLHDLAYVEELKDVIATRQRVNVGNPAVDFSGKTPNGNEISLSDYQGKVVLVQFWASWCGPCRRSNPDYVRLHNQYKDHGFDIFSVSLDSNKDAWVNAIQQDNLAWSHISDLKFWDSEPASLYGIRHIPSNVLIDPNGIIIGKNLRGDDLDNKLAQLF